jgi:hypothetical protein
MRRRGRPLVVAVSTAGVIAATLAVAGPAGAEPANLTWAGASTSRDWSMTSNWSGSAPVANGSYGTLHLGTLGKTCNRQRPTTACYSSKNDVEGLSVNRIDVNSTAPYSVTGDGITLGAGGINANAPEQTGFELRYAYGAAYLGIPITLGANQTWVIDGNGNSADIETDSIAGAHQLTVDNGASQVYFGGAVNVSALNLTGGAGQVYSEDSLNAGTDGPVTVSNTDLQFLGRKPQQSGPLSTTDDGTIAVGWGEAPEPTLQVNGDASFVPGTSLQMSLDSPADGSSLPQPGADYSQLTSTGTVTLDGSALQLTQGLLKDGRCVDLKPGDVYTLVSAASIAGTFQGIPNGHTVRLGAACGASANLALTDATATINYTPTDVTATIKSGGHAGDIPVAKGQLRIEGDPVVGHTLTAKSAWTSKPTSVRYSWQICSSKTHDCTVSKNHSAKLKLATSTAGAQLFVTVTAKNKYGSGQNFGLLNHKIKPAPKKRRH